MSIQFDKKGNLGQTVSLSYRQLEEAFGFNEVRKALLKPLLLTLKLFQKFGCTEVYIAGSFTSNKAHPAILMYVWI